MGAGRSSRRLDSVDVTMTKVLRLAADPARSTESSVEQLFHHPVRAHLLRRARARVAAAMATHRSIVGEQALRILDVALARTDAPEPTGWTAAHLDRLARARDVAHA